AGENTKDRTLAPGLYTGRLGLQDWPADEIAGQIYITRYSGVGHGNVHFSMKWIMADTKGIGTAMRDTIYAEPALVPAMPWIDSETPAAPIDIKLARIVVAERKRPELSEGEWFKPLADAKAPTFDNHVRVTWRSDADDAKVHVVQYLRGGKWHTEIVDARQTSITLGETAATPVTHIAVSTVNRIGNQSEPTQFERPDGQ
ncbi:MAG: hypothetical protein AAF743_07885, partial [Planctomycetota bacterium]